MQFEAIATNVINDDQTPWIPFMPYSDQVQVKYYKIDPVHGEIVVMLKSPPGLEMARHHHTGTVIVYTVQGSWKYKEHDWTAHRGSVVYETASSAHTPQAMAGDEDVIAFNIIRGELIYTDENGQTLAVENWKTSIARYLAYCEANGITPRDLTSFAE